ncbi:MAG: nucleotidyltransferase family protein, partial [Acidimicrobiia bacterium]
EAVAAHGLRSEHRLPEAPLDADAARGLTDEAESHRVLGLMTAAVRDGALVLDAAARTRLDELERGWLGHDLRLERLLLRARARLGAAGIESRVLKGVALAHTVYRDPSMRVFGDVDLLVPSGRVLDAVCELEDELTTTRVQPELRRGFDDRFGKEVMLRPDGLELDLHRIFVEGALGLTIDIDDLFAPPYRFAFGGAELEALPMPQRLLHACYAAALGDWPPRVISLRDVAQLVVHERPNLADVLLMARRWQCEAVVARAVTTAWERLRLVDRAPIVDWAQRFAPSRREQVLLAAHEGPARAFSRHLAAIAVLPGVRDRVAYATAIALPRPEYLHARGMTARSHVTRAWHGLRRP